MDNQKIKIWIRCRGRSIKVVDSLFRLPEDQRAEYQPVVFTMRPLTWGANNDLIRRAKITKKVRGVVISDVDQYQYRAEKFLWALVDWDYKDAHGQPVPVTEANINLLHEAVVEQVLKLYDRLNYLSDDEKRQINLEISNYIQSQNSGQKNVAAPSGMTELSLIERFHWTPEQINQIGMRHLQTLFTVMNQKDLSLEVAQEQAQEKQQQKEKRKKI